MAPIKNFSRKWDTFERRATRKVTNRQKKLWNAFIFLSRFALLAIPFHLILWTNFDAYPLQVAVAKFVSKLLSLSGAALTQSDNFIYISAPAAWTIEIIKDCVGWKSFLALSGLIFAVRGIDTKKRISGIVIGALVVFIGNIIRIYTSVYASMVVGLDKFAFIHDFLWQAGTMALILASWLIWLKYACNSPREKS